MTPQAIGFPAVVRLLQTVSLDLRAHVDELTQLDAVLGDGDLGVTVDLACGAILGFLSTAEEQEIGNLLVDCGKHINSASPSTFGTLLASAFRAAGQAVRGQDTVDPEDLVNMGRAAVSGVQKRGKAQPGDKTLLDVLVPAVDAFDRALTAGQSMEPASREAIGAAEAGMNATAAMRAKYGRASWHGDKSIGVQDAGATAFYYLLESLARHSTAL